MKRFKKVRQKLGLIVEIILFLGAIGIFCYSGYKVATHFGLLSSKVLGAESCDDCSACQRSDWVGDLCRRIRDWCEQGCSCHPTPTSVPQPTPTSGQPTPTEIPSQPTSTPVEPSPTSVQPTPTGTPEEPTPTSKPGEPTPTGGQTASPTPTLTPSGGIGGEGGGGGGGGGGPASPCTPPEAPKTPTLLSAVAVSGSEVKLTWTKVDRATHYAVAYGESSHNYTYGNPNIGNTDSYVVGGLSLGKTYYFAVSAAIGGDCPVASPYSNEISARPSWVSGAKSILGIKEEEEPEAREELGGGVSTQAGEVAGAKSKCPCPFWAIALLLESALIGGFLSFWLAKKPLPAFWWLSIPLAVLLTYLLDRYAHTHWYVPSRMCRYEPYLGVVLAGLEITGFKLLRRSHQRK